MFLSPNPAHYGYPLPKRSSLSVLFSYFSILNQQKTYLLHFLSCFCSAVRCSVFGLRQSPPPTQPSWSPSFSVAVAGGHLQEALEPGRFVFQNLYESSKSDCGFTVTDELYSNLVKFCVILFIVGLNFRHLVMNDEGLYIVYVFFFFYLAKSLFHVQFTP